MTEFIFDNLEVILAVVGGLGVGAYLLLSKAKKGSNENDLTHLYIRYKKHTDNITKSAKGGIF